MSESPSRPDEKRAGETVLQLTDVNYAYDGKDVLNSCNFSLLAGDYCVVLGRSGSGKSTLLRLIAGLISFESGLIEINQSSVAKTPPRDRNVSLLFQDDRLYPHWTIRKTLTLACQQGPAPVRSADELQSIAKRFRIVEILDRRPDEVSGGQLRRAALAKAILRRPAIMLLDEPLHGLDACLREEFLDLLANVPMQRGCCRDGYDLNPTAVIHVTHDGEEAMRLANRVAVLDQGQVVQAAAPTEVYRYPKTLTVAMLLGNPPPNIAGQIWWDSMPQEPLAALEFHRLECGNKGAWIIRPESIVANVDAIPNTEKVLRWQAKLVHSRFVNGHWVNHWQSHAQTWRTVSFEQPPELCTNRFASLSVDPQELTWVSNEN